MNQTDDRLTSNADIKNGLVKPAILDLVAPLPLPLPVEAPPATNVPVAQPAHLAYVFGLLAPEIRVCLTTEDLQQIAQSCRPLSLEIGKADFVNAVAFHVIYRDRRYRQRGFSSFEEFLDSLPEDIHVTRQSGINYARAGEVLVEKFFFHRYGMAGDSSVDLSFLYGNFSKLPILWRLFHFTSTNLTAEVYEHFSRDSVEEFRKFIESLLGRPKRAAKKKGRTSRSSVPQSLSQPKRFMAEAIQSGRFPGFVVDYDAEFTTRVMIRMKVRIEANDRYRRERAFDEATLIDKDPAKLHPSGLIPQCILALDDYFTSFSLEGIMTVVRSMLKAKSDVTLVKGYLIVRLLKSDRLRAQLPTLGVQDVKEFAKKYLDVDESMYKWLVRLVRNFMDYAGLFGSAIDIAYQNSLDKLFCLDIAIKNYPGRADYVIEMFRKLSAVQFRRFARDTNYDPTRDLVVFSRSVLERANSFFLKYDELIAAGHRVEVVELRNEDEVRFLDWIVSQEQAKDARRVKRELLPAPEATTQLLPYHRPLAIADGTGNQPAA
jgi:hypothetical protein